MTEKVIVKTPRLGKLAHVTIDDIREVAKSIGKPAALVSRWANEYRRREAENWLDEVRAWLNGIHIGDYYEDVMARMPDDLISGNKKIDDEYSLKATKMTKEISDAHERRWQEILKKPSKGASKRAEIRRQKREAKA